MGEKLSVLCELNGCSDSNDKRYPECECRPIKQPTICPKRNEVVEALNLCGATPTKEFCAECEKEEAEDEGECR